MFSNRKNTPPLDLEQHELIENAQRRMKQKKRLYTHFVLFLIGSVTLVLFNKILKYGQDYDWSIWAITIWGLFIAIHTVNVFIVQRFLGQEWERAQREKLVAEQKKRIAALQKEIETDFPLSNINKKKEG